VLQGLIRNDASAIEVFAGIIMHEEEADSDRSNDCDYVDRTRRSDAIADGEADSVKQSSHIAGYLMLLPRGTKCLLSAYCPCMKSNGYECENVVPLWRRQDGR
jgi:hypothetical protein